MTDYTKVSGGTLMIRDTGSTVQFRFKARDNGDWENGLDFSWTANGSTSHRTINYPTGADWYNLGSRSISSTQTVTFRLLTNSSKSGIGGPTSFSVAIKRGTVPKATTKPVLSKITTTTLTATFSANSNGGNTIVGYQITYGTSPDGGTHTISSDRSTAIADLTPGTTYYFWARAQNILGWGPWSSRASANTIAGAYVKVGTVWKRAVPYVRVAGVWKIAIPYIRSGGVWKQTG